MVGRTEKSTKLEITSLIEKTLKRELHKVLRVTSGNQVALTVDSVHTG